MTKNGESKRYMIIDNDAGVDDSLAIMTALHIVDKKSPGDYEILALTCAPGNSDLGKVVINVSITLDQYGRKNIPVYKGCWRSVSTFEKSGDHFGDDGLGNAAQKFLPTEIACEDEPAASALVRLVKQHPKQVTLVCLAPLTNIAVAYLLDPHFFDRLESMYIFGGDTDSNGDIVVNEEYNFSCDRKAAKIVLSNSTCPLVLVQYRSFLTHSLGPESYGRLKSIQTKRGRFFSSITELRSKDVYEKGMKIADVLLVCAFLLPEAIVKEEKRSVKIKIGKNGNCDQEKVINFIHQLDMKQVENILADVLSVDSY